MNRLIIRRLACSISNPRLIATTTDFIVPTARCLSTNPAKSVTQLIKELRTLTGAPMMECKKALSDPSVNNDVELATEWLRKHGSAKASSKVSGRDASEGLVGLSISPDRKTAGLVKVSSETDFASRSEDFTSLVEDVAEAALGLDESEEIMTASVGRAGVTVKDALDEAILSIRENLQIAESSTISVAGEESILAGYVHGRAGNSAKAGVAAAVVEIVKAKKGSAATDEEMAEVGKKLAMHVVAAKPDYLSPVVVPEEVTQRERGVLMEQMADSGKPADILEKVVTGRMRKFYEGSCLTEQPHMVEEDNPKVSKFLSKMGLEVRRFERTSIQ